MTDERGGTVASRNAHRVKHYTWRNTLRVWRCYALRHRWSFDVCRNCFWRHKTVERERW